MGGLTSKPKAPPPPPPVKAPAPMPDPEKTGKHKQKAYEKMRSRSGRQSTILSDQGGKLGG